MWGMVSESVMFVDHGQKPKQEDDSKYSHEIVPTATTDLEPTTSADSFGNSRHEDKEKRRAE
jgi:hypothetical protein